VVVQGREEDFAEVFRLDGVWQEFLRRSPGYLASELLKLSSGPRQYEVFDYWRLHEDFESCRRERQQEIERFSLLFLESVVQRETFLGGFYEDGPDESGLVLR
jgi:hypothetical protein